MKTASPTAGRTSQSMLLMISAWMKWKISCADVKAAFLSGKGFSRTLVVKLPMDCLSLIPDASKGTYGKHLYMKMLKSAYGLCDAPLLWYQEASSRLLKRQWQRHPLDQCCFLRVSTEGQLIGMLILHVDDMLITGNHENDEFKEALSFLTKDFDFGKWDELSPSQPLKYCGGTILMTEQGIEVS